MLPPPVSADRVLALAGSHIASLPGFGSFVNRELVDTPVGRASPYDPFPSDHEDELPNELLAWEMRSNSMQRLAWLDYSIMEDANVGSSIRLLCKRKNVDFLLGESDVVVGIPDDDPLKFLEGMSKEVTKHPREPNDEPKDVATLGGGDLWAGFK